MKLPYIRLLTAITAGLWPLFPVEAQEMRWQYREGENGVLYLAYEVPETGVQSVNLTCDIKSRQFSVSYVDDRDRARDGMRTEVEFTSENGRILLPMLAELQELDDQILLRNAGPLDGTLLQVFKGKSLQITFSEETENIPLAGAQKGIAMLAERCSGN